MKVNQKVMPPSNSDVHQMLSISKPLMFENTIHITGHYLSTRFKNMRLVHLTLTFYNAASFLFFTNSYTSYN